jgi:outer membrane protein OmpA-like peptidoglycan-associated protein
VKRAVFLCLALAGCVRSPKPVIFAQIDAEREKPHVVAAREGSPTLYGKAEALKKRAEEAYAAGDTATAELLGHHALAAYEHAAATARLTAATIKQSKEAARAAKLSEQLVADDASRLDIDREADRLEAEVAIRHEALAPAVSGKTDPAREAARWTAARANLAVADALCNGAHVLAPKAKGVEEARKILADVVSKAKNEKDAAPIDSSTRARSLCLKALTNARALTVSGGGATGDALVKELADAGLVSSRDERGVIATLPASAFEGSKLTAAGKTQLDALGKIAKARSTWAIVVVVHAAPGKLDAARDTARAKLVQDGLAAAGADASRVATSTPGASLLAYDNKDPKNAPKNERVEVIFVGGQ